jgi:uncharacterized ferredoxin-like protein
MIITGEDVLPIVEVMEAFAQVMPPAGGDAMFMRLAYEQGRMPTLLLIGADLRTSTIGYDCGACGFDTCGEFNTYSRENPPSLGVIYQGPSCIWKTIDFSISCAWACAAAWQYNITNRIQGTSGMAAQMLGCPEGCSTVLGMPVGPADEDMYWYNRPGKVFNELFRYEDMMRFFQNFICSYWESFPGAKPMVKAKDKWWEEPHHVLRVLEDSPEEVARFHQDVGDALQTIVEMNLKMQELKIKAGLKPPHE